MSDLPLHIDPRSVKDLMDSHDDIVLFDCREVDEHRTVCIEGAKLVPLSEAANLLVELEPYRQRHIVAYCHHGGRSLQFTLWLRSQGFDKVQNMMGGIDVWALLIDTSLPRY